MHRSSAAILTAAVLLALPVRTAAARARCTTMARLAEAGPRRPPELRGAVVAPGAAKLTRAGFPGDYQVRESANFALKWRSANVGEERAEKMLALLEAGWARYHDDWGQAVPPGADLYRVNVFLSRPGEVPAVDEYGYSLIDEEGFAYIALGHDILFGDPDPGAVPEILAHELQHSFQWATGLYSERTSWWFWEASAEWAASELHPALRYAYYYVGSYGLRPDLAMFFYDVPHTRPLVGTHQYGAMLFLRYLTDRTGEPGFIARAWTEAEIGDDPLEVLGRLLPDRDLAAAFSEFAGRQAAWDFPQRDLLLWSVDWYIGAYPGVDRIAGRVGEAGTAGWATPVAERTPHAFGLALIEIARPPGGALRVAVEPDASGSVGSPAALNAQVVTRRPGGISYHPVTPGGQLAVDLAADAVSTWLVVDVASGSRDPAETFGFRYSVEPAEPDDPPADDPGDLDDPEAAGCAAAGRGASSGGAAVLVLLAAGWMITRSRAG